MKEEQLFLVGQKALIEKDGKVLVLFEPNFGLDFPGGKIQQGELGKQDALRQSLAREVREETGLEVEVIRPLNVWHFTITRKTHPHYGKMVYVVLFLCKYVSGEVTLSREHNKFEWADKSSYSQFSRTNQAFVALERYFHGIGY